MIFWSLNVDSGPIGTLCGHDATSFLLTASHLYENKQFRLHFMIELKLLIVNSWKCSLCMVLFWNSLEYSRITKSVLWQTKMSLFSKIEFNEKYVDDLANSLFHRTSRISSPTHELVGFWNYAVDYVPWELVLYEFDTNLRINVKIKYVHIFSLNWTERHQKSKITF